MLRVALLLVLANYTLSQPVKESFENAPAHTAPQYDFVKCCPCPGSPLWEQLASGQLEGVRQALERANDSVESSGVSCPCQGRAADAEGSPSLFTPKEVRLSWSELKSQDSNEDGKTILQPEVDMASKVLETLREATDEEYQDALARDAARNANAHEDEDTDKPLVTIVLNPRSDDALSEASNAQEARCVPLDSSNLGQATENVPSLLKPLHKLFDLDNSPTNAQEKVAGLSKGLENLKLRNNPSVISFLPGKDKTNTVLEDIHAKNMLKLSELGSKLFKNAKSDADGVINGDSKKTFDLKTHILRRVKPLSARKQAKQADALDASPSPSEPKEQTIKDENKSKTAPKPLLPRKELVLTKTPLSLGNLLNLKDVELLPTKPLKLNLPKLNLLPPSRIQNIGDEKSDVSRNCDKAVKGDEGDVHKTMHTEILDAIPSPSEHKLIINDNDVITEHATDNDALKENDLQDSNEMKAEVAQEVFEYSEPNEESGNDGMEITISSDGDTEIENITVEREFGKPQIEPVEPASDELQVENISGNLEQDTSSEITNINQVPLIEENDEDYEENVPLVSETEEPFASEGIDTSGIQEEDIHSEETDDSIPATSNDAFQFASEETVDFDPSPDFQFKSENPAEGDEEIIDSGDIEAELKAIDQSSDSDFKSVESNDHSAEIENIETFPDADLKSAESSQDHSSLGNSEKSALEADTEQHDISDKPSLKERISIKFKSLKSSKSTEPISRINKPSKIVDKEIENTSKLEAQQRESQVPVMNKEIFEEDNLSQDTSDVIQKEANDDMASSATSNEPEFVEPVRISEASREVELCPCNQVAKDTSGFLEQDISNDDSNTGASVRQNLIVQPATLFDEANLFDRPLLPLPALPALNLNTHIPTLEELNSRITGLLPLGGYASETSHEDSDEDCYDANPKISPSASTNSLKSLLPPLRPLEDINLDIFQLKPLGSSGSLTNKIPSLNLNTFKTRLALPENLGLKPLELQSSMGNKKNGMLGATLRFGPTKIGSRNKASDILGSSLGSLPNLDEIKDTMKSSASSLLKSPAMILPSSSFPTIDDISERLRSHTESLKAHTEYAAKNIHNTLGSTLSVPHLGTTKSKFAKPHQENVLEKIASAHDDMNDKLRAIHMDFTDRLTTLHDNILENSKLPQLKLPHAKSSTKLSDMLPLTGTFSTQKQSSSSNKSSQRKSSRPSNIAERFSSSHSKSVSDHSKSIRPFKLSTAASSLQPKNIEVPKLMATSTMPPFAWPLHKSEAIKLREREPLTSSTRHQPFEESRKLLRNTFKPLGEVKISIGTTPRPTMKLTTAKPVKLGTKSISKARASTTPRTVRPTLSQRLQATKDSKGHASEVHPSRTASPTLSRKHLEDTKSSTRSSQVTKGSKLKTTKKSPISVPNQTKVSIPKEISTNYKGSILKPSLETPQKAKSPLLTLSKTTESPVITKLREALKARLATKPKAPEKLVAPIRSRADQDMLRSASENNAITVVQKDAMQENVTYKCKMMCVREP